MVCLALLTFKDYGVAVVLDDEDDEAESEDEYVRENDQEDDDEPKEPEETQDDMEIDQDYTIITSGDKSVKNTQSGMFDVFFNHVKMIF